MLQLKCTRKLLDFSEVRNALPPEKVEDTLLGDWHATIVDFLRPGLLVFINDKSLYCVIDVINHREKGANLPVIFRKNLFRGLQENHVSESQMSRIFQDYWETIITKTDSRSVLGTLNDINNHIYSHIEELVQENERIDLRKLEQFLNMVPHSSIGYKGYKLPREVFKQLLGLS
ncbi:MAG: hypothetical protein WC749_12590 [Dehalococcoidia bacterium]